MTIFVLNPGSSSLKAALFKDGEQQFSETIRHDGREIAQFAHIVDQLDYRMAALDEIIKKHGIDFSKIDAIAARGGFCRPVKGGTFSINEKLLDDLRNARYGEHAANLSPMIADILSKRYNIPAYFTDPVSVDEFMAESYVTGLPSIKRSSQFHALNQRVAARTAAEQLGKKYEDANLVVAHMGGGITIGAHKHGRVVDAVNPADDGPMCIDRPGALPNQKLIDYVFDNKLTREQAKHKIATDSGFIEYFGMTDLIEIEERGMHDKDVALLLDAMSYRVAYYICAMTAAFKSPTDAVVLTGGMAKSDWIVPKVTKRVEHIGPVIVLRGEKEMEALVAGAERVLRGEEQAQEY